MKPIIGIVSNITATDKISVSKNNVIAIEKAGGEPMVIVTKYEDEVGKNILEMCDGFLFQGGANSSDFHYNILEYAYKNNKPIMGICLGFQMMARYFFGAGSVDLIDNAFPNTNIDHQSSVNNDSQIAHNIIINKDSYMYDIFGSEAFVNSRHQKTVVHVSKPFTISCHSQDGVIEGYEHIDDENYIVGVQFHPEDLEEMDILFKRFVKRASLDSK